MYANWVIVKHEQNLASYCNDISTLVEIDEYFNLANALCYVEGNGEQGTGLLYKLPSDPDLQFTKKEIWNISGITCTWFKKFNFKIE